jgi:hypothetical protein
MEKLVEIIEQVDLTNTILKDRFEILNLMN